MASKRDVETRLDEAEGSSSDSNGWRELAGLSPEATRADGWRAALEGEMSEEAWTAYFKAGQGGTSQ